MVRVEGLGLGFGIRLSKLITLPPITMEVENGSLQD